MAKRQRTAAGGAPQPLPTLPPKRPQDTQTAWEDPWAATLAARQALANSGHPVPDPGAVGQRITKEINEDPREVERLRSARKNARAGRTFPRHSDTK